MSFIDELKARAKSNKKTIVLPESMDARVIEAASKILEEGFANIVLLGDPAEIAKVAPQFDISGATIIDPKTSEKLEEYVDVLVELRKKKGMTPEQARELMTTDYMFYA